MIKSYIILGLDIGIGSCGWALLDMRGSKIIDMGVHLWNVPQKEKTKESLAAARRAARSARRNTKRRSDRAKHCLAVLKKHGLAPNDATKEWLQTVKGDPQPLESRVAALDGLVSDRHLAQALYSICKHRGYIPHGKGDGSEGAEGKKVLSAIDANKTLMAEKGYRTVGEMMLREGQAQGASCGISRNKDGNYSHCLTMAQLLEEVEAIFSAQRSMGNPRATEDLQKEYIECMTWEKDTADHDQRVYDKKVGYCVYLPGEHRAAKACISFERCTAFERISNVRIISPDGAEHSLPAEVRRWCMDTLFSPMPLEDNIKCKVTFKTLRKRLDMSAAYFFKGIDFNREESKEVAEPKVWRKERSKLPTKLLRRMLADCDLGDAIGSALAYSSTEATLRAQLELLPLSESEIDVICSLPFSSKAFSGYGTRSVKALQMLCDAFEDFESVGSLSEAEEASGLYYQRIDSPKGYRLPPYTDFDKTCENPVVLRAMGRVRKLVNAVIAAYGMPDEIHIELAPNLKRSKKEKEKIDKANKSTANKRKIAKRKLAEDLGCSEDELSGKLLRKYELWEEQKGIDIYSGSTIQYERMLSDSSYCQIDHILPYSRTCDDGQFNKVLVLTSSNQQKKDRSPYEWLSENGNWDDFQARVISMEQQGYPFRKCQKLLECNLDSKQKDFIERNLNDTRYASRAAKNYIERYLKFPEGDRKRRVIAVAGGATSALRSSWGFAKKDRSADDCHHAADAAVIAACNESMIIKVAKASEKKHLIPKEQRAKLFADTEPWEGFARQVEELCATLIPTRKVDHGGTGHLFKDTTYSFRGMDSKGAKALMSAGGKIKSSGNYILRSDGSALLPDGQAFLRLWWDDEKKMFLREIVYFADLAAINSHAYTPRYFKARTPRPHWPVIPKKVLASTKPIVIHHGDAVLIGDEVLRYKTCNSSNGTLSFVSMRSFQQEASPKTIPTKLKDPSLLKVVEEDILGQCYKKAK